jgi:hypothetical protein
LVAQCIQWSLTARGMDYYFYLPYVQQWISLMSDLDMQCVKFSKGSNILFSSPPGDSLTGLNCIV